MHRGAYGCGEWRCIGEASNKQLAIPHLMNGTSIVLYLVILIKMFGDIILWFWPCYMITVTQYLGRRR
jgi:hypothetical protein